MNITDSSVGYLTVRVSTARGAIPLEGATVNIRGNDEESSTILYSLLSGNDGKTPRVPLAAPPKENSDLPGGASAFSTYNIDVFKEGYVPLYFHNVPIFPSVISVQPAVMVPADSLSDMGREQDIDSSPSTTLE
ncbi:MAG: hypothetical protein IJ011_10805 [Clostridia bacterium]|nr:hypothetical protein [Clostridia bacterium]MBQ8850812.1 hypothetical protein [Clostridia bacterium]